MVKRDREWQPNNVQSIFYCSFIQFRVTGGLEPIPSVIRREAVDIGSQSQGQNRDKRETIMQTPRVNLESPIDLTCMFLDDRKKMECLERTYSLKETCKLQTERPLLIFKSVTFLLWDNSSNHTVNLLISASAHKCLSFSWLSWCWKHLDSF